jgi:hypothetical protein
MRRECKYGMEAREQYKEDHDKNELVNTVWTKITQYTKARHVVENSTRAILELIEEKGKNTFIDGKSILEKAQIFEYRQNGSYGLWPWLENTGAGIIQEQGEFPESSYRISNDFFEILNEVVTKD